MSSNSPPPLELIILEDDPQIRALLQVLLNGSPGFWCQQSFATGEALLEALPGLPAGLVLMDIDLGHGINGIETLRRVRAARSDLEVVMLTVHEDATAVFDALCAGAVGYLVKGIAPVDLLAALRSAADGGAPMSPQIARRVVKTFHVGPSNPLTPREREVLRLLCEGDSYRRIAEQLHVSG
ncbi:MAG: response regulator transcription factor, partial [Bacteroidota bacterium]